MDRGKCKACGSTTHVRSTHRECPYNKKRCCDAPTAPPEDDDSASDDSQSGVSLDESDDSPMSADDWCYEDDIIRGRTCLCGAGGRAVPCPTEPMRTNLKTLQRGRDRMLMTLLLQRNARLQLRLSSLMTMSTYTVTT